MKIKKTNAQYRIETEIYMKHLKKFQKMADDLPEGNHRKLRYEKRVGQFIKLIEECSEGIFWANINDEINIEVETSEEVATEEKMATVKLSVKSSIGKKE